MAGSRDCAEGMGLWGRGRLSNFLLFALVFYTHMYITYTYLNLSHALPVKVKFKDGLIFSIVPRSPNHTKVFPKQLPWRGRQGWARSFRKVSEVPPGPAEPRASGSTCCGGWVWFRAGPGQVEVGTRACPSAWRPAGASARWGHCWPLRPAGSVLYEFPMAAVTNHCKLLA